MTLSWRTTPLADRHLALGSKLEDWNGLPTAWTYDHDINEDHVAIRTKAGLMDVSGLKKVHVVGPHADHVVNSATTRDVTKIPPGKALYATMLDDRGMFVDDCIIYHIGPNSWMVVHGTGGGHERLLSEATGRSAAVIFDDDLQDLSLQGPLAVDYLAKHIPDIRELPYFRFVFLRLFGRSVMISRTGYTGERGYEIFCKSADAPLIWDTILEEGAEMGITPCSFAALDMLRVESSLVFYPDDNSETYPYENDLPGDTLWELGLDFTVSPGKTDFRGSTQHYDRKGKERFKIFGVLTEADEATNAGDRVFDSNGNDVGVITCGMYSTLTNQSMAFARLDPVVAEHGTPLEVRGESGNRRATAHTLPFDDPDRKKRTARG